MDITNYLERIGYSGKLEATEDVLNYLHRAHVLNVPFENFHIINHIPIYLDQQSFYQKIVESKRGGFCYELNGLFSKALNEIGLENYFIGCSVYVPSLEKFGMASSHLALIVTIEEQKYLVDVGFGDAFLEPLKLNFDEPVFQFGSYYRLSELPEGDILLEKSIDNEQYQKMYKFPLKEKRLEDFVETCHFHQTSPLAPFNKKPLCSRATSAGRITLTSTSLTITNGQQKKETDVTSSAHFNELLEEHFGMRFKADPDMVV